MRSRGERTLNVLITAAYYRPETSGPAVYVTGPAEYLAACGHDVTVVTGYPHYPTWRPQESRRPASTDLHAGVVIRRRWHHVPGSQSALSRALYEGSLLGGGLTALGGGKRPDVVVGVVPTLSGGAVARAAAVRFRCPYGLLIHDLMGAAADQGGVRGGSHVAETVRRAELALARRAAGVGIVADGFRRYFEEGGVGSDRIVRLRTWTVGSEPTESVAETRRRLGWGAQEFVCLHGGNMGHKQALDTVLHAADRLRGERVRMVLAGDGNDRPRLEREARSLALANLSFAPPQSWGRYESMLRAADVLLVNQRATVRDMSLPSKLTSYFAVGRPVIAAVAAGSETAREVLGAGGGLVVTPEDPGALADSILRLKDDERARAELGRNGRSYAARHLTPEHALPEYERFVRGLARA